MRACEGNHFITPHLGNSELGACAFVPLFCLLKEYYESRVLVADCRRFIPDLLQQWSEAMVECCGTSHAFFFFAGKNH